MHAKRVSPIISQEEWDTEKDMNSGLKVIHNIAKVPSPDHYSPTSYFDSKKRSHMYSFGKIFPNDKIVYI
jgi:hypothetical protein